MRSVEEIAVATRLAELSVTTLRDLAGVDVSIDVRSSDARYRAQAQAESGREHVTVSVLGRGHGPTWEPVLAGPAETFLGAL